MRTVLSVKLKEALEELKPAFRALGKDLEHLTKSRAEIAPAFIKAYTIWTRETRRPFIAFVHALDPSMPVHDRKLYREHPSYRAAFYIKDRALNPEKYSRKGLTQQAMLALAIKSFLPVYETQRDQKDALQVLLAASKWRDADQRRLLAAIRRAKPVGLPKVPRLLEAAKATKAVVVAFERERLAS